MISRIKMTMVTGAAVLATAAAGTGMASAQSSQTPTPAPSASASTAPGSPGMSPWAGHCMHGWDGGMRGWGILGILRRIEHGQVTLMTAQGQEVVDFQRGTVTSVSPGQLTVRSVDGFSATYAVNNSTKIRKDRKPSDIAQVMTNDQVIVVATQSGNTATATHIIDIKGATTSSTTNY